MSAPATPAPDGEVGDERFGGAAVAVEPRSGLLSGARAHSAVRVVGAVGAGVLLFLSFPPRTAWWLAPIAFALLGAVLHGRRVRAGAGYGLLTGLAFFAPLLSWTGEFVGPAPWLALAALQAVFVSATGAGIAAVSRLPAWPVWATGVWAAGEGLRGRVPFDGFPWGDVAFGQPDGPFAPLAAVGGAPLVGAAVTSTGFTAAAAVIALRGGSTRSAGRSALLVAAPIAAALAAGAVAERGADPGRTVVVAAVQGNVPRLGLDFNAQRRAVLDNHVAATERLAADVAAGRERRPDLVLWPENSADIDPLRNADARAAVDRAAAAIGAPVLVGAVLNPPRGPATNSMIVWDPVGGPGAQHVKRRLQPFGEYVPYRDFFRRFSPLVDRASDFTPGDGDGAVDIGGVRVGVATCYEVIFDDLVRESVRSGAELLVVPSNNATFGLTDMTYQQLAIDRIRAIEHGRTVVVPTTSGVSAVIDADGRVLDRTGQFTADVLTAEVALRSDTTAATRIGAGVDVALVLVGVGGLLAPARAGVRRRRRSPGRSS